MNALVWRLHEQSLSGKKKNDPKLSISKGRSMCVDCRHELAWYDLVPLASWLSLGGRCRYCRKPISRQYPAIEALTAMSFVTSYIYWPLQWGSTGWAEFGLWLASVVILIALLIYDAKWMLLPNRLVFPGIAIAVAFVALSILDSVGIARTLAGAGGSIVIASGLFYWLFIISKGKWIGGGDVKLGIMTGLLLGTPAMSMLMLFVASVLGTLWALPGIIKGSGLKLKIPFGPFLITATFIVFLFGQQVIDWYVLNFLP